MIQEYAQQIAEYTSKICGYAVILTDENARIIGSSEADRLGQINDAAKKVIEQQAPLTPHQGYIDGMKNTLPGITLPIQLNQKIYGTIGIQGERSEVEKYGLLIKKYTELFLRDRILMQTSQIRDNALNNLLYELIQFYPHRESAAHLLFYGDELGFDLRLSRVAIIVDMRIDVTQKESNPAKNNLNNFESTMDTFQFRRIIRSVFSNSKDLIAPRKNRIVVILHVLKHPEDPSGEYQDANKRCNDLLDELLKNGIRASIAIGSQARNIEQLAQSLREARDLTNISHIVGNEGCRIFNIQSFLSEIIIHDLQEYQKKWIQKKAFQGLQNQNDREELLLTIQAWCESMFNHVHAAKKLGIHRNTLSYRLDRIENLTGYDPRSFNDILGLYIGVLLNREKNNLQKI